MSPGRSAQSGYDLLVARVGVENEQCAACPGGENITNGRYRISGFDFCPGAKADDRPAAYSRRHTHINGCGASATKRITASGDTLGPIWSGCPWG